MAPNVTKGKAGDTLMIFTLGAAHKYCNEYSIFDININSIQNNLKALNLPVCLAGALMIARAQDLLIILKYNRCFNRLCKPSREDDNDIEYRNNKK